MSDISADPEFQALRTLSAAPGRNRFRMQAVGDFDRARRRNVDKGLGTPRPFPPFPTARVDCGLFSRDAQPRLARSKIGRVAGSLYERLGSAGKKSRNTATSLLSPSKSRAMRA